MGYSLDLDEYTEERLIAELKLREDRRREGLCDYCNRTPDTEPCKFPERHRREKLYYLQDTRQVVGNCALWWATNDGGYTTQLHEAGVYTEEQAKRRLSRNTERAYLKDAVDACAVLHMRAEKLRDLPELKK